MKPYISFLSIVVVRVDDGEGAVDQAVAGQNGLAGAKGFLSSCRLYKAAGKRIHGLEGIGHFHAPLCADLFDPFSDNFHEILFNIPADHKYDLVKAGFHGVIDGIIHDDLSVYAHGLQLLDAAAESGSDSGCHNDQCSFHCALPS